MPECRLQYLKYVQYQQSQKRAEVAKVAEFLNQTPNKLKSWLRGDNIRLSEGQVQRVMFTSALLSKADLLIPDEAVSDSDSNLEQEVQTAVETAV